MLLLRSWKYMCFTYLTVFLFWSWVLKKSRGDLKQEKRCSHILSEQNCSFPFEIGVIWQILCLRERVLKEKKMHLKKLSQQLSWTFSWKMFLSWTNKQKKNPKRSSCVINHAGSKSLVTNVLSRLHPSVLSSCCRNCSCCWPDSFVAMETSPSAERRFRVPPWQDTRAVMESQPCSDVNHLRG